jgi:histidinol-phosphate aminotransferase
MQPPRFTRRQFARALGIAAGASLAVPPPAPAASPDPAAAPAYPEGTLRLDSNENPYGPSPRARAALRRARDAAARYPDPLEDRMTAALARRHGVGPENVILGCGSGEVLRMADMAYLGPGRCVVAAEPTFEAVLAYARVTRARPVKVPLTADFRHDLPRLAAACPRDAGLLYVCNPNNPTGTIVTRDELAAFLRRVPRDTPVVVDEAYHHFVEDDRYASALEWIGGRPRLLVVRTFSKIYGLAGMRLGYGVGSKETIEALAAHRLWSNTNAAVLEAALACLDDDDHVEAQRRLLNGTRRWLAAELDRDGRRHIPSQANFLMIDTGRDVGPVIAAFRERGLLVGRRFASMPTWLRISIGTPEEMAAFLEGLRALVPARAARRRTAPQTTCPGPASGYT